MASELTDRLRAWARRYEPRSPERTLMLAAAERITELEADVDAEVSKRVASIARVTPEMVEAAMGGATLLPWQRKKLEEGMTPPSDSQSA
jgi:hypothetical protein